MAENIINVDQLPTQPADLLNNTDSVLYVINNTLRRVNQADFMSLLNDNLKGEKGDRGLTGNRGERGYRGLAGQKGDTGEKGAKGDKGDTGEKGDTVYGWSPLFVSVVQSGLVYLYLTDWVGGNILETKPTVRGYLSPTGFVNNVEDGAISVSSDFGQAIAELTSEVSQKMPITATTDAVSEGSTNRYYTDSRVILAPLTGLNPTDINPLNSTDSIIAGFGKTQAQLNLMQKKVDLSNDVQNLSLSQLSTQGAVALNTSDTIIVGFGKLQAQINTKQSQSTLQIDVRATTLSGLSLSDSSAITSSDSIITGFGKTQAQLNLRQLSSTLQADVRSTPMTGLSTSTSTAIAATDTLIVAVGKAQAQINLKQNTSSLPSSVRAVTLSGLSTATSTEIIETDTILVALGKLQAQLTSLASRVTALETA